MVFISESDAEKLAELSGIEIPGKKVKKTEIKKTILIPFKNLLVLNEWEKHFDGKIAWKNGVKPEPESKPVHSFSFDDQTPSKENHQLGSAFEQILRKQNNCIECGKLVYDKAGYVQSILGKFDFLLNKY